MTKPLMGKPVHATYTCKDCKKVVELKICERLASILGGSKNQRCDDCVKIAIDRDRNRELMNLHHKAIERSQIPVKYRTWDADKAKTDWMLMWVEKHRGASLWLGGTNDIGKTHTTHYVAYRNMIDHGVQVLACRCSSWLREVVTLRAGNDEEKRVSREMLKFAQSVELLILDDLGKESLSDPRAELLLDLIDVRERDSLPVWITTNHGGRKLMNRLGDNYGPAIKARLERMIPENDRIMSNDRTGD